MPSTPMSRVAHRCARIATALVGAYALAAATSALIARVLPLPPVDATAWGSTLSFALYVAAMLWALADRRLGRVVLLTWGGTAALVLLLVLLGHHP